MLVSTLLSMKICFFFVLFAGIPFEALTVYETEASQDISKNLEILLKEQVNFISTDENIVYY